MKKQSKAVLFFVLFVAVVLGVLLYTYREGLLSFGATKMNYSKWDIHFEKLHISTVGDATYTKPIFSNTIVAGADVSVEQPGDSVTFQFQVVNGGTLKARLSDIVMSIPRCSSSKKVDSDFVCDSLVYELREEDGKKLAKDVVLEPSSSKLIKLIVEYPKDADSLNEQVTVENLDVDLIFSRF